MNVPRRKKSLVKTKVLIASQGASQRIHFRTGFMEFLTSKYLIASRELMKAQKARAVMAAMIATPKAVKLVAPPQA